MEYFCIKNVSRETYRKLKICFSCKSIFHIIIKRVKIAENKFTYTALYDMTADDVYTNPISDIEETSYNTIRLPYDNIDIVTQIHFYQGSLGEIRGIGSVSQDVIDEHGNVVGQYQKDGLNSLAVEPHDVTVYQFESEEHWAMVMGGKKTVGDNDIVIIKNTGEMVMGNNVSSVLKQNNVDVGLTYDKTGFAAGELRPEFYYNSTDKTNPSEPIEYKRYEESIEPPPGDPNNRFITSDLIRYDIEYNVATNQNLAVNIEAIDVFDSDVIQDVNDMINLNESISDGKLSFKKFFA